MRPTPGLQRPDDLRARLVVAVEARSARRGNRRASGEGQLAAGADVEAEALLGRASARRACTGTPCPRRRRRRPRRRRSATRRIRARKSASSRTKAGVPCSPTRSRTSMPRTVSAPDVGSRSTPSAQSGGSRVLRSSGAAPSGASWTTSPCRGPAGWARMRPSFRIGRPGGTAGRSVVSPLRDAVGKTITDSVHIPLRAPSGGIGDTTSFTCSALQSRSWWRRRRPSP